ncbi:MAG: chromosome segregation ATPase, partial [Pirellulaceae bacterium]
MDDMETTSVTTLSENTARTNELVLRILTGRHQGKSVRIQSNSLTLGSDPSCQLRLRAPGVRQVHCKIQQGRQTTTVTSLAPDTLLNGRVFTQAHLRLNDRLDIGSVSLQVAQIHGHIAQGQNDFGEGSRGADRSQTDLAFDIDLPPGITASDNLAGLPLDQIDSLLDRLNEAQRTMHSLESQSNQQRDSLIARLEHLESQVRSTDSAPPANHNATVGLSELDRFAAENARLESRVAEFEELLVEYEQRLEEQRCRAEIENVELMGECEKYKTALDDSFNVIGQLRADNNEVETRLRELGEQSEVEIERLRVQSEEQQQAFAKTQQQIETRLASLHALVEKREIQTLKDEHRLQRAEFERALAASEVNLANAKHRLIAVETEAAGKVAQTKREAEQVEANFIQEKQNWQASQLLALQLQQQSQDIVVAKTQAELEATQLRTKLAKLDEQLASQQAQFIRKEGSLEKTLQDVLNEVESLQQLGQSQQLELDTQNSRFDQTRRQLEANCNDAQQQSEKLQAERLQLQHAFAAEKEAWELQQANVSEQESASRTVAIVELQQQIERLQANNQTLNQHLIEAQEESERVAKALAVVQQSGQSTEQVADAAIREAERLAKELNDANEATQQAEQAANAAQREIERVSQELAEAQQATLEAEQALEESQLAAQESQLAAQEARQVAHQAQLDAEEARRNAQHSHDISNVGGTNVSPPSNGPIANGPNTGGRYPTMPTAIAPMAGETMTDAAPTEPLNKQLDPELHLTTEDASASNGDQDGTPAETSSTNDSD